MNINRELSILNDIKEILSNIKELENNVFIVRTLEMSRKTYVSIFPIETVYGDDSSANFSILISLYVAGRNELETFNNIIQIKNKIINTLNDNSINGKINNIRYIKLQKENYVVDTNKNTLYLRGIDMEFNVMLMK